MAPRLLTGSDLTKIFTLAQALNLMESSLGPWARVSHGGDHNDCLLQVFGTDSRKTATAPRASISDGGLSLSFEILPTTSVEGLLASYASQAGGGGVEGIDLNTAWRQRGTPKPIRTVPLKEPGQAIELRLARNADALAGPDAAGFLSAHASPVMNGGSLYGNGNSNDTGATSLVHELLGTGLLASAQPTICHCPACSRLYVSGGSTNSATSLSTGALGLDLTFKLHSNPTANQRIYLDFDGYELASSEWENGGALRVGAFFSSPLSDAAKQAIQDIWRRVTEDFAPFNIDVTTEEPNSEDLKNSGDGDSRWGIRVAMTTNKNLLTNAPIQNAGGGGTAYLGSFNWATDDVCLVFNGYNGTSTDAIYAAAETASHEVGHTLGLIHDGGSYGSNSSYYEGHGSGVTSWGAIMGAPFINADENVTTWSKGEYIGANNQEDDLGIITGSVSNAYVSGNGFTYRNDDYGNSFDTAYTLSGEAPSSFGIIERNTDIDWFRFSTASASVSIQIRNACRVFSSNGDGTFSTQYLEGLGPNLAISAQLFDANGYLIATSTPSEWLDAGFSLYLSAGVYYLSVEGVGLGNPFANPPSGFTDYGSIGQYLITSSITPGEPPINPVVIAAISDDIGTITGPIAEGATTDDTTPTISGTIFAALAPGSSLRVYRNDVFAGDATVTGTAWSYTPASALASGTHRFKAAIFSSTNVSGPFSDPRSIVIDIAAPTQTVTIASVSDNTDPVQGLISPGGRTNDTTPTLAGTLSAPLQEGESLKLFNGSLFLLNAEVSGTSWTASPSLPLDATYSFSARVVDAAGNQGPPTSARSLILDTSPPTQTLAINAISDNLGTITGLIPDGAISNDTTPTLSGSLSAALATAEVVRISCNGGLLAGNATVSGTSWTYTPATPLITNGTISFNAQVFDGAGNAGTLSPSRSIVLDAPISTPAQDTLTGIAPSADIYLLPQLSSSLLGSSTAPTYDSITNFEASDKLQVAGLPYKATLTASSGTAAGLDPSQLTTILPSAWTANTARAFKVTGFNGTFVALNNSLAGFQSDQDAILFLNGYNPSTTTPIGIL